VARWQHRRECGELNRPDPAAPTARTAAAERAAILTLFQAWGEIDRSTASSRTAALGSTGARVRVHRAAGAGAEGIALPGNPRRDRSPGRVAGLVGMETNHIWADDFTHFTRARRAAIRSWTWCPANGSPPWSRPRNLHQVEVAFTAALDAEAATLRRQRSYMITNLPTQYSHPWPLPAWLRR